jgi:hypothetical protein
MDIGRIRNILDFTAVCILIVPFILFGTINSAWGEDGVDSPGAMATVSDLVVVRPVAAVGSVLSSAVFSVTLPFTYHDNNGFGALGPLVEKPWDFVANRPLGVWQTGESPTQRMNHEMDSRYSGILGRTFADTPPEEIR